MKENFISDNSIFSLSNALDKVLGRNPLPAPKTFMDILKKLPTAEDVIRKIAELAKLESRNYIVAPVPPPPPPPPLEDPNTGGKFSTPQTDSRLYCFPSTDTFPLPFPNYGQSGVAANETARVWGDPHFEDPDGGRFDVQGEAGKIYDLFHDTNLALNAQFDAFGKDGKTVIGKTGLTVSGFGGISQVQFSKDGQASINGIPICPGMAVRLADGGFASLSLDGKELTLKTHEGYRITQKIDAGGYINVDVTSPAHGVATDGRMPGGLLGQTFDADKIARNGKGQQGEGAIAGNVKDYEMMGGVFGNSIPGNPSFQDQSLDFFLQQMKRKQTLQQISESDEKSKKLEALLQMLLATGNIDLAMLVIAQLETNEAKKMVGALVSKLQEAQASRRAISEQMGAVQGQSQEDGQNNIYGLQSNLQDTNDTIQMLTTLIKDVSDQKNRTVEFASNFLNSEHQTTMSIVRGMRG